MRQNLTGLGAELIYPERLMKRVTFNLPKTVNENTYLRVRDEGDKVTLTLKAVVGNSIEDQKEINIKVDSFSATVEMLKHIGCQEKAYQETKRELWRLSGVEVTLDEWPFLEPFIEVEGPSEALVKQVVSSLGFDYTKGLIGAVDKLYAAKYKIPTRQINYETPLITFDMDNPFLD